MAFDIKQFASAGVLVSDGAWGTELHKRGLPAGAPPELWNTENAEAVEAVARSYVDAGSDVIISNTFCANRFILGAHGAAHLAPELAEEGVLISRRAAGDKAKVFASVGPTGKIVMMGEIAEEDIAAAFAETAEAVEFGGADAILLESFSELEELRIAIEAVAHATDLPVIASMTFASGPDGAATMMGNRPADLVKLAESLGVAAVGANCGKGPEHYINITRMLRAETDLPIWIKPNAGLPQVKDGKTTFPMGAEEFSKYAREIISCGANFIGGCCGTTPEHIKAVRKIVDAL